MGRVEEMLDWVGYNVPQEGPDVTELFRNRQDAGRCLAGALAGSVVGDAVVLGLARGGVIVAAEAARTLGTQLDVLIVRKVGAPTNPEYAIGAVVEGGDSYLSQRAIARLQLSPGVVRELVGQSEAEASQLQAIYRSGVDLASVRGRSVVLVDDGLATGATMRAAVASMRRRGAGRVVVACPVGSAEALAMVRQLADQVTCPVSPPDFFAVGFYYERFEPVSDAEVLQALQDARSRRA